MSLTPTRHGPVYLVDDDPSVLNALRRLLRVAGFRVEGFGSAAELRNCRVNPREGCLVLDVQMPETDGLELREELMRKGVSLPVIFITAHDNPVTRRRARDTGAIACLNKPVDQNALIEAVHAALRHGGQR